LAGIFKGVMHKEVGNLKAVHPECYLPAYAIHLYLVDNVLTDKEQTDYTAYVRALELGDSDEEAAASKPNS
jgi:hypothetical protein